MALDTYPAAGGGGIKSVQRGLASSAGTVTITAVDISKSFVQVFGTTSSGTIAASGTIGAQGHNASSGVAGSNYSPGPSGGSSSVAASSISGGTNNLLAATAQGYLSNSTSLVVSHPCRWEVIEFA
jgi:hypothetical protein